jgi:hypothetical protein
MVPGLWSGLRYDDLDGGFCRGRRCLLEIYAVSAICKCIDMKPRRTPNVCYGYGQRRMRITGRRRLPRHRLAISRHRDSAILLLVLGSSVGHVGGGEMGRGDQ